MVPKTFVAPARTQIFVPTIGCTPFSAAAEENL